MSDSEQPQYHQYYNQLIQNEEGKSNAKWKDRKPVIKPIKIQFDQEQFHSFREICSTQRQNKAFLSDQTSPVQRDYKSLQNPKIQQRPQASKNLNIRKVKNRERSQLLQLLITNPKQKIEHLRKQLKVMRKQNEIFLKIKDNIIKEKIKKKINGINQTKMNYSAVETKKQNNTASLQQKFFTVSKYNHEKQIKIIKNGLTVKKCHPLSYISQVNAKDLSSDMQRKKDEFDSYQQGNILKRKVKNQGKCFTVAKESPTNDDISMKLFLIGRLNPLKNVLQYVKANERLKTQTNNYLQKKESSLLQMANQMRKKSSRLENLTSDKCQWPRKKSNESLFDRLLKNRRSLTQNHQHLNTQTYEQKSFQRDEVKQQKVEQDSSQSLYENKSKKKLKKFDFQKKKKIILSFKSKLIDSDQNKMENSLINRNQLRSEKQKLNISFQA